MAYNYFRSGPHQNLLSVFHMTQAVVEPGENWIDETYERKVELGPLPGWELPLEWTTPDVTADQKASSSL